MATLQNYTSSISVARSIEYIERQLVARGSKFIQRSYDDDKKVTAIFFQVPINGVDVMFKVQANIDACLTRLQAMLSLRARPETKAKLPKQAERTAWKIVSDFIEVQMTMIDLGQRTMMQVFLSDVYDPVTEKTCYERMAEGGFKLLLGKGVS